MPTPVPRLRQELTLHPGPSAPGGAPTWTLHDPPANRFFTLNWVAFELLSRWDRGNAEAVLEAVNRETTLTVLPAQLSSLCDFLIRHDLTIQTDAAARKQLLAQHQAARPPWWKQLLKHYLFFRIPLFRPRRFLLELTPRLEGLFQPWFWGMVLASALLGGYLVSRQWESFWATFMAFSSWKDLIWLGVAISISKIAHELGHAVAATRAGCRVGTMGVAFLVLWPMLYTDTTESWKLPSRRPRLTIGIAGMAAELALAAFATLAWSFLPAGPPQAAAFFLATTTWVMTLMVNLSPFMRFDGYFILSDWLGVDNLHARSFALGRWWLREQLFGLGEPPPERFPESRRRGLIAFALGVWIYRLVLFFSIALLVYHLFFKLLGILLMVVEIVWFIALPMVHEMNEWWKRRQALVWNRRTMSTAALIGVGFALVLIPWQGSITTPAVWKAGRFQAFHAPSAAQVEELPVAQGGMAAQGKVLLRLDSPDLRHDAEQAQREVAVMRWQMERQNLSTALLEQGQIPTSQLEEAEDRLRLVLGQLAQLTVTAPFDGQVAELNDTLRPGVWVAKNEPLLYLVDKTGAVADGYLEEGHLDRLLPESGGRFIPDRLEWGVADCQFLTVDRSNTRILEDEYLATHYGGDLPVRKDVNGVLVPVESVFRVRLDHCQPAYPPNQVVRGHLVLEGKAESLLGRLFRKAAAVLIREGGF